MYECYPGLSVSFENEKVKSILLISVDISWGGYYPTKLRCQHGFGEGDPAENIITKWGKPDKIRLLPTKERNIPIIEEWVYSAYRHRFYVYQLARAPSQWLRKEVGIRRIAVIEIY